MFTPSRGRILIFLFVLSMASVPLGSTRASAGTITTGVESYSASAPPAAPAPYRVAVQIGHYKNSELPEALSRLSGHTAAYGGGRSEVDLNYDVAQRLAAILRGKGVVVDILPATIQTGYTADAFVAVHADGNSSAARGFKISTRWRSQVALQDGRLVEMLTDSYRGATGLPEDSNVTRNMRGYYSYASWRPNYRISNLTPGAIVEVGFMTNAADRQVMFKATDKVASGIAGGVMNFLQWAYGSPRGTRTYGYGHVDSHIDLNAPAFPAPTSGPRMSAQTGDWQVLLMSSKPTVNIYDKPGGGVVIATLPRDQFLHSTMRKGDYYRVSLPGVKEGWVHRNAAVVQM